MLFCITDKINILFSILYMSWGSVWSAIHRIVSINSKTKNKNVYIIICVVCIVYIPKPIICINSNAKFIYLRYVTICCLFRINFLQMGTFFISLVMLTCMYDKKNYTLSCDFRIYFKCGIQVVHFIVYIKHKENFQNIYLFTEENFNLQIYTHLLFYTRNK